MEGGCETCPFIMLTLQDTKIFIKNFHEHETLNKKLKKEITEARKNNLFMPKANDNCWRSVYKYKCENELLKPINLILSDYISHYFNKNDMTCKILYWTNINGFGGGNLFHTHYRAVVIYQVLHSRRRHRIY